MFRNYNAGAINVKATFAEACKLAHDHGFTGIDVGVGAVKELGSVDAVKAMLDRYELRPGAFGFPNRFLGAEEEWKESLRQAPRYLEMGRQIGSTLVTGGFSPASDTRPFQENFDFHVRRLAPAARVVEEYGFKWAFEFLGPMMFRRGRKYTFVFDADGTLELCNAIRDTTCGLLFDVWHWYTSGGTIEQVQQISRAKALYLHVNDAPSGIAVEDQIDNVRCLPGETGVIDVVTVLRTLADNGCQAPVTVEPFNEAVRKLPPAEATKVTAKALARVWNEAGLDAHA